MLHFSVRIDRHREYDFTSQESLTCKRWICRTFNVRRADRGLGLAQTRGCKDKEQPNMPFFHDALRH